MLQWLCTPALRDTTSEPPVGNSRSGAPVKASATSGGLVRNQGGTVEYINVYVSHP